MMTVSARYRLQMFCAWCGFIYIGVLLLGWTLIAGFLPPHHPSDTAQQIAAIFQNNAMRIRVGMVLTMLSAFTVMPFTAILAQYVARIENRPGVLTYSVIMGGTGNMILTFYPAIFWLVAAFRPDRPPEIIYMLNDWAWLQLIGGASMFWTLPLGVAIAALCDGSADPVFPRWSGFASLWSFFAILPDQLLFFFHTGPFAWNGIFGFWIPLAAFGSWFMLASTLMILAMRRGVLPDAA